MEHTMNERMYATTNAAYNDAFWNAMRGKTTSLSDLEGGRDSQTGTYWPPLKTASSFSGALKEQSLFRRIGTVMPKTAHDSKIWLSDNENLPQWISEDDTLPTTEDNVFPRKDVFAHKLAIITTIDMDFVSDLGFDLESYLVRQFSRRFGKAEEDAFINGTGASMPKGFLHDTDGAGTGVTITGNITFDDVVNLYFSVDKRYRGNGMWLINDETALKLKTLKDQNGQYLWNQNSDTILGKPIHLSEYMPSEGKPIAFGDFSYYTIIDRMPLSIRPLYELHALGNKMGFLGIERLDGMLIRPEAVKVLSVSR